MPEEMIIDVSGLCKSFNGTLAVDNLALQVKRGEVFGFLGPNGSGKTTSIRMLCGLLIPDAGEGTCLGYDILTQAQKIKPRVGYMTQHFSLYTDLTIEENLEFVAKAYDVSSPKKRIKAVMKEMGLTKRAHQFAGQLSGGWKQRLSLAACLLHKPDLLLLDEPTAGIDPIARREFWDKIHSLSEQGMTTLMSTHYMDEAERCTRLAYLAHSKLVITGNVSDVIASTHLKTWAVKGEVTTSLLQTIKRIDGVEEAALFGREIHVSGLDEAAIKRGLLPLAKTYNVKISRIEPSLEDAFINLVNRSKGNF